MQNKFKNIKLFFAIMLTTITVWFAADCAVFGLKEVGVDVGERFEMEARAQIIPSIPQIPPFPDIQSNGNTYHVDKDVGDNSNDGSSGSPWATIQYGVDQLTAGDTLIVHEGNTAYAEAVNISKNGTSSNWITIKGANGERPKISGYNTVNFVNSSSYIYLKNFDIDGSFTGIRLRGGTEHVVLDDIDIDGGQYGLHLGNYSYSAGVKHSYIRNVEAHSSTNRGFYLWARSEDVTFERCIARNNGDDGFGGHLALAGDTWENVGPPDDPANVAKNIYFLDCESYSNQGDGFDLGLIKKEHVFKNCISRDNGGKQGNGFKVWGDETWFINCLAYDNNYSGINLKPLWDANIYILHNIMSRNNVIHGFGWGGQISVDQKNSVVYVLKNANIYLYDNIFHTPNAPAIFLTHTNGRIIEEDHNYYYSDLGANDLIEFRDNKVVDKIYSLNDIADGTWYSTEGFGQHDIAKSFSADGLADPGFTNLANDDYTLIDTSLAVDAGTDVGVIMTFLAV